VKPGTISFTINFDKPMNNSVSLNVTFGKSSPYLQNTVKGDWSGSSSWKGDYFVGTQQIIDDDDSGYSDTGGWAMATGQGYGNDVHYMSAGTGLKNATWKPLIGTDGSYSVYVSWTTYSNRATDAKYTVHYNGGNQTFTVNQQLLANQSTVGGVGQLSGWYYLGSFNFKTTSNNLVVLTDNANNYVIADAVRFDSSTTLPGDGAYRLRIAEGKDVIGNLMNANTSFVFYVDTQTPVVRNPQAPAISYLQDQTIKVQAYDLGSGFSSAVVQVGSTNYTMQSAYNDWLITGYLNFAPIGNYYAIIPRTSLIPNATNSYRFFVADVSGNVNDSVAGGFYVNGTYTRTGGAIAYLCRNDPVTVSGNQTCTYGIEQKTIQWLRNNGWKVDVNKYSTWTATELKKRSLIVCSDQHYACVPTSEVTSAYNSGVGFVEITDSYRAAAGYAFSYVSNQYGLIKNGETDIFITAADSITAGYIGNATIYNASDKGIGYIKNEDLDSSVVNVADIGNTYSGYKSSLFKVENSSAHGRYAWVGWFYSYYSSSWTPQDLNALGQELFKKTLNWAQCGNAMGCAKCLGSCVTTTTTTTTIPTTTTSTTVPTTTTSTTVPTTTTSTTVPTTTTSTTVPCYANGVHCSHDWQCCSDNCHSGTCQ